VAKEGHLEGITSSMEGWVMLASPLLEYMFLVKTLGEAFLGVDFLLV